jgi:hypothetical protein
MFELNIRRRDNLEELRQTCPKAFEESSRFPDTLKDVDQKLSMEVIK